MEANVWPVHLDVKNVLQPQAVLSVKIAQIQMVSSQELYLNASVLPDIINQVILFVMLAHQDV